MAQMNDFEAANLLTHYASDEFIAENFEQLVQDYRYLPVRLRMPADYPVERRFQYWPPQTRTNDHFLSEISFFLHFHRPIFAYLKKNAYLCIRFEKSAVCTLVRTGKYGPASG